MHLSLGHFVSLTVHNVCEQRRGTMIWLPEMVS